MSTKSKAKPSLLPGRKASSVDLDSILDQALDDFETQELDKKAAALQLGENAEGGSDAQRRKEKYQNSLKIDELMKGMHDPRFGSTLHSTLSALSGQVEGQSHVDDLFRDIDKSFEQPHRVPAFVPGGPALDQGVQGSERAIVETLSMITRAQDDMHGFEAGKMEEVGEQMMEDMISQFEALGDKEDYNEVIDGVMRQLLSRDLMYEPMKNICAKFPEWLALHKINLPESDYNKYGKQYQTFQRLLAVYDMEPDNFPRLMELMFDLQEHGQPPADIIKDLAPGLKFDENGMPIMPVMPMPADGTGGFPNLNETAQQMASGQCSLM